MKIVGVGGSGLIGSKLVATLTRDGHEVVAASRRSGFDAVTGEGLAEGLRSASVVIDVSNSPSFEDAAVLARPVVIRSEGASRGLDAGVNAAWTQCGTA